MKNELAYNLLAVFCIVGTSSMFIWSIRELKKKFIQRSDEKSELRRAGYRRYYMPLYQKRYTIRKNREELFYQEFMR